MTDRVFFMLRSVLGILLLTWASTASATPFTYTGTTTGEPTWNRPIAGNPPTSLSGVGTAVPYSAFTFSVTVSESVTFQSTATAPAGWDNYTFLYQMSFDPLSPLTNALAGNDDNPSIGLSGFTHTLSAGTTYIFVTTGFSNSDFGDFSNTITPATGNVIPSAVPEPSTWLMLSTGLLGLLGYGWRKQRHTTVPAAG